MMPTELPLANDLLVEQINEQILQAYLEIDERGRFLSPPQDDDELHEFIRIALKVSIPRKVIEPGHKAPFEFMADMFFERVANALVFANRHGGKCLALDTHILTTTGWKTMGGIQKGDYVYAPDGSATKVLVAHKTHIDHECFEVEFDSGEVIVADADHLWDTARAKQDHRLWTTREMFDVVSNPPAIGYKTMFEVQRTSPLKLPEQKLPIDPYVVGAFLGDGCRWNTQFYSDDPEIVERIRETQEAVDKGLTNDTGTCRTYVLTNIRSKWRHLKDRPRASRKGKPAAKFCPSIYLLGSIQQRTDLLRGLMDTDGSVSTNRPSRCEFTSKDRRLAEDVHWLVHSLGGIAVLTTRKNGYHRVVWRHVTDINPFYLSRKADLVECAEQRSVHRVVSIRRTASVPVRCIQVAHPSHLFLAGINLIPTHNTFDIAILNLLDLIFKPGCEIASAGAVKDQAKKCYSYMKEFMEADWFTSFCHQFLRKTGRSLIKKDIQEETTFRTGSTLQILTATSKGVRGPHPHKARLDEIDEMDWDIIQTGLSMASSSKGIMGQNCFSSTRQYERGSMQRFLETAAEKDVQIYEWNVWETVEKCTRRCFDDPEHGDCSVYTFCKGKAHRCDGFIEIQDFIAKLKLLDRDRFETEWLNEKPSRTKLVYGKSFIESRHIMTPEKLKAITGIPFVVVDWSRTCGIDFGGGPGHPFVYLKLCQLPNGAWMLFFEYVAEQRLMRDHAKVIKGSPWWHRNEWNYSDHARQDRMELKNKGVNTRPANKAVTMGIDYIEELLSGYPPAEEPMLYIWYQCTYTIMEFGLYSWPIGHDGKVQKDGPPEKKHDHTMDALRYALYSLKERPKRRYRARKMENM